MAKKIKNNNKPKYNMFQNAWFMIKLAIDSKEKKVIVLCFISSVLALALNLINLYVSPMVLKAVEIKAPILELILTIGCFILAMMIISAISAYVNSNTLYGRIAVRGEIVNLLNRKAATTSYPNIDDDKFINLLSKSSETVSSNMEATEAIWSTLTDIVTNIFGFIIYVILLSTVQPLLIVMVLVTTIISYFVSNYANNYRYRHREEEARYERHMQYAGSQASNFSSAKDIRIFGLRPWLEELYNKAHYAYTSFQNKSEKSHLLAQIVDIILTFLRNGLAYWYLINLVINGGISISEFLLFFTAVGGFTQWVSGILNGLNTLHKQSLDISIVRECLEYPELFNFEGGIRINKDTYQKYEIKLENVTFRYPTANKDTLTNINLTLHPGEKLAVVGLNGAGKTTLVKLICGFLSPTSGRVLLNNQDIKEYNRRDYYTLFSAVFQTFSILAGTIDYNVAQSDQDIDHDKVIESIEKAGLREKIESLPNGYLTKLNRSVFEDAILLSGGETQRLMLARALYKDAPFIILDEPTAALDPIAEADLYQKYNDMTLEKSSIYISHRLASTRFCDRIIMIDGSIISEEGTHEELLKNGGQYASLYEVQSKYYKEGDDGDEEER